MPPKSISAAKETLHPRNLHRHGYDFEQLVKTSPALGAFVKLNKYNNKSIDFADPKAVLALNQALLTHFYNINDWAIPPGYLCPPIPGRADYIHNVADLLATKNNGIIPISNAVKVLDVGTGANCVYPLIGNSVYGWQFTGTDIDPVAIASANKIIASNPALKDQIRLRLQTNPGDIFNNVIKPGEFFELTVCNPPFHSSWQEAQAGTTRKWANLNKGKSQKEGLNFGGKNNELWVAGGEAAFIKKMIDESVLFATNVLWFTTLVSKKETLDSMYKQLTQVKATDVKTINMAQGQKISRVVVWTFKI